jgi:IclR family transcriptional regulator, pca regulon regulatory protein
MPIAELLFQGACLCVVHGVRNAYKLSVLRTGKVIMYALLVKGEKQMIDDQSRDHVQSIERCLAVLEAFTGRAGGLSFGELALATGLSKPTIRRILLTLEALGFARSVDSRFSLTPKILRLGYAYLSSLNLTEVANPLMEALTDQLRESSALSAMDGVDVVYLNRVHRHRISSMALAVGTRLPAYATSSGHILLADLTPDALADYFARAELKKLTDRTLTTTSALIDRLEAVRARDWDIVDQELEIGRIAAAVPVLDSNGVVVAALSCSWGTREYSVEQIEKQFVPTLRLTAEKISAAIGGCLYAPRRNGSNAAQDKQAQAPRMNVRKRR